MTNWKKGSNENKALKANNAEGVKGDSQSFA